MPETTRTGTFIAPGIVLTSNAEVERRFHIRGVNQVFADYVGSRSESFSMTRAADPAIDAMLQDCYLPRRANPEHCLVDVRQDIVVRPYTRPARAIPVPRKASSRPHDPEVLFLVLADANTECRACPPITVDTLEDAVGTPVVAIAATGHDPLHPVFRARLTDDHEQPLTQEDEASAFRVLGPAAAGAPLISTHGAVAGMLVRDGDGVTALPADHIYDDAATEWRITPSTADYTHHVQEGVGALEGDDFTTAEEYFSEIVQNTGQTVVADLLERTRDRAAAAPEPSASAEPSSGSDTSFWPVALSAAVLAVLAGLVLLTTRMRRAGAGAGAGPRTDRGAGPVPGAVSPTPAGRADRAAGHDAGAGASHGDSHGEGRPVGSPPTGDAPAPTTGPPRAREETAPGHEVRYCTECGAGLAPGDRFCYSCGTPTARG